MADIGAVGRFLGDRFYSKTDRTWTTGKLRVVGGTDAAAWLYNVVTRAKVSGVVRENNVVAARTVRAYRQDTGVLLGSTTSSAIDGTYQIFLGYTGEVAVVAFDAAGAPDLNAVILAKVTPA